MAGSSKKGAIKEIENVQVDGLVALKVIKHCQEEGSSSELVTGFLVGLVVGTTLEITNCFPLPKELDDQEEETKYQVNILKKLRSINVDYHQVGWYQSTYLNSHINKEFLESHVRYQQTIEESIVLIYDPLRTANGVLSLKAFRLTDTIVEMVSRGDSFSPESVQKAGLDHKDMLKELPVTIRNSRLMNALLCELDTRDTQPKKMDFLGLSSSQLLKKNMQLLMESVETLQQDNYRLIGYEKALAKQAQSRLAAFAKRKEENARRAQQNEPLLPITKEAIEQELNLRPVNPPPRLDALLAGEQVELRCQQVTEIAGNSFGKLYLTEGLQQ
ncbi:eukaryotic translation initiation factor 3 subunit H-like [Halichondria panicea]|uniref:eukaryotic translation initiation factor 3 subunit H-like n=1 Tax=Halichondria panicea TaxID=6063 RepID=UPI00312BB05C